MNKKIKIISLMAIVAIASAAFTFALFSDQDSKTNTFTTGNVDIKVYESKWDDDCVKEIAPGVSVDKDPVVQNIGKNDCYIRVKVEYNKNIFTLKGLDTTNWVYNNNDGYYYYTKVVNKKIGNNIQSTTKLFTSVEMNKAFKEGTNTVANDLNVIVSAQAVQADGFTNYSDAFKAAMETGDLN